VRTLRHYIDVTADGSNQDWSAQYASTAWEAVLRSSNDTDWIEADTLAHRSDFTCGDGATPELGLVTAVTVHYRARTSATSGTPDFIVDVLRAGAQLTAGQTVAPTVGLNWVDGSYRVEIDSATSARFVASGLTDLGCMVEVTTAPTSGYLQVTELWLEVEWLRSPAFYDPVHFAALPSAIVGTMKWANTGTQAAAIASNRLRLTDASTTDWKAYQYTIPEYGVDYVTEATTRFSLTSTLTSSAFVYHALTVDDGTYQVELNCFLDAAGDERIGLTTDGLDRSDEAAYLDTAYLDWTDDHHYRLVIDRDDNMDTTNHVRVYVDYSETPALEAFVSDLTGTSGSAVLGFGTGSTAEQTALCVADVSFVDWWSYLKDNSWRHWHTLGVGNNTVAADTADTFIARPVLVQPPRIWTGQSEWCCILQVPDLTDECSVWTYFATPDALRTYDVSVDYRVDTLATGAKIQVQRASDHYYWNNGGSAWQAAAADVSLSYSPIRTRVAAMSSISTTAGERLIIKVRNDVAAGSTHNVFVYKLGVAYS